MKVLLVGPDYEENLSIRYLSSSLQNSGHEAMLGTFNSLADAAAVEELAPRADIVGLSMCFQARAQEFLSLAKRIKAQHPQKLVVAGGHYASCAAQPLLADHPELDILVIHEGEHTLVEIANALPELPNRIAAIAGIAYRDGKQVRFTPPRRTISDLDALPFPDRCGRQHVIAGIPTSYMMGSRGCYGQCAYCCITTLHRMAPGKLFRQRDPESIAEEMAVLYHERGSRQFVFHDDNFLVPSDAQNHARINALERALGKRGVKDIALVIKCRPADASRDVLQQLKEFGLVRIFMGIESSTEEGLATLQRKQAINDSVRALEACSELDISAQFTMMIFNPDATLATLRSDIAFMRRFCGNPLNFCRTEIYTGTPLEKRMIDLGRARGDYRARDYKLIDPVADRACDSALDLFAARCWNSNSLMQRAIGLDHVSAVLKRFHAGRQQQALCAEISAWLRSVNLDTVDLLDEVIDVSAADRSRHREAVSSIAGRESASREGFLARGLILRSRAEALPFQRLAEKPHSISGARFARTAAAALLAVGMPAISGLQQAVGQESSASRSVSDADKNSASLAGKITDQSGAVISNATITITNAESNVVQTLKSNATGDFLATGLAAGRYTVRIAVPGFKQIEHPNVELKAGVQQRLDVKVEFSDIGCCEYAAVALTRPKVEAPKPLSSLSGAVTDAAGAAIASATVTITQQSTKSVRTLKANQFGRYEATGLKAGHYSVIAYAPNFQTSGPKKIVIKPGESATSDFKLAFAPNFGCCEYAAAPLKPLDLTQKVKPFTYEVGQTRDDDRLKTLAKIVYGNENDWVLIFEANRGVLKTPLHMVPGTQILIPKQDRLAPKLLSKVEPTYPPEALQHEVTGEVLMDVSLKDDGTVDSVEVIDGRPELVDAAVAAVKKWRFAASDVQSKGGSRKFVVVTSFGKKGSVHSIVG